MGRYESPGVIGKPGPIGRWWRFANGVGTLSITAWIVANYPTFTSADTPSAIGSAAIAFAVSAAFLNLPSVVSVGFGKDWGLKPALALGVPFMTLVVFNVIVYGNVWSATLGLASFWLMMATFGFLGLSYLVAGILAVPG